MVLATSMAATHLPCTMIGIVLCDRCDQVSGGCLVSLGDVVDGLAGLRTLGRLLFSGFRWETLCEGEPQDPLGSIPRLPHGRVEKMVTALFTMYMPSLITERGASLPVR